MPGKKHLSKASAKENRMYEHIKQSEQRKEHRSPKRAKQIAAATVRKRQSSKRR
jgi:hypothetical protein